MTIMCDRPQNRRSFLPLIPVTGSLHLILILLQGATCFYFKVNHETYNAKAQLSPPWTTRNIISCTSQCKIRFQNRCMDVIFNNQTLACTPVYNKSRDEPNLEPQPGDVLYSQVLTCDSESGFQLYQTHDAAACVLKTSFMRYHKAVTFCAAKRATVYVPHSYRRFALLQSIARDSMVWAGLKKVSGVWGWQNGQPVDAEFYDFIWIPGQPNNEDCGVYNPLYHKLDDYFCIRSFKSICEQNY